jgi:8-oxo-dGTP pyrophosphatase MutT (NUDIX family)
MTGSSVLPVTVHRGKLVFLFGKENPKENGAKGFSDFGGGVEKGESIYETALREGGEELTGFLGDGKNLRKLIKRNGGHFDVSHGDYHVHLFYIPYDPNLVTYYNLNHKFLWERMNRDILNKSKLFEKIEIQWFDVQAAKKRIREFRSFYQHVLRAILKEEENILHFIKSKCLRQTRRARFEGKKNKTTRKKQTDV